MTNEPMQGEPGARTDSRSSMFVAAVLRAGAQQVPVKVRNMSLNGAMLDLPHSLPPGTKVELIRGSLFAKGSVVWCSASRCGLRFDSQLSIRDWLAAPTKVEQDRVNAIVSLVKAGGIPNALVDIDGRRTSTGRSTKAELIEGLSDIIKLMQDLEDDLATSEKTLALHGPKLQNLDIAIQMTRAILQELTSQDSDAGQQNMATLADLRIVCAQALRKD